MLKIIRNASVDIKLEYNYSLQDFQLTIIVDEQYVHVFPVGSKESKMCHNTEQSVIQGLFNGGTFAFFDGALVDYRSSAYRGFIHTETGVDELSNRIGIKRYNEQKATGDKFHEGIADQGGSSNRRGVFNRFRGMNNNGIFLGGEFDRFQMDIAGLSDGGNFENRLIYRWSPFSDKITTSLEVMRLICLNGMVANAPLVTYSVPLINDWEANLNVVSTQLQPRLNGLLSNRFLEMRSQRATVRQIVDANGLLMERAESKELNAGEQTMLQNMISQTSPEANLSKYYDTSLFSDKQASSGFGGHLTQFDVYNILTEASSHYGANEVNDRGIQRYLNGVVFDSSDKKNVEVEIPESADSDHRRAFFGSNK